jgi:hypothetical protein
MCLLLQRAGADDDVEISELTEDKPGAAAPGEEAISRGVLLAGASLKAV